MDIRAQRTKSALREALLVCLKEKPAGDLSVKEICDSAGCDRTTFYKHYKKIDDMLFELEQEQLDVFRTMMQQRKESWEELLVEIFDSIDRAKEMYRSKDGSIILSERFKNGLIAVAKEYGFQEWKKNLPEVDEEGIEISFEALLAGTLHAVLAMGEKVSNKKKAKLIMDMIHAYIESRA